MAAARLEFTVIVEVAVFAVPHVPLVIAQKKDEVAVKLPGAYD